MKVAVCFPGQALFSTTNVIERLGEFACASPLIDQGLSYIDSVALEVSDRTISQLQTFIASVASYQIVSDVGVEASVFAEHSMGIYAALVAAGAMQFSVGLSIVKMAGDLIDQVAGAGDYEMAAITGLGREAINAISELASETGEVYLANINGPREFVLSGDRAALSIACGEAKALGATDTRLLGIGAPIHTNLLAHADQAMRKQLATQPFSSPTIPIVEHIYGGFVVARDILDLLCQQLFMPVKWPRVMEALSTRGIDAFIELAPGDALSKLIALHRREATIMSLGLPEQLDQAIKWLGRVNR